LFLLAFFKKALSLHRFLSSNNIRNIGTDRLSEKLPQIIGSEFYPKKRIPFAQDREIWQ